jgi:tetratricopeptide (TPR) repeat protein
VRGRLRAPALVLVWLGLAAATPAAPDLRPPDLTPLVPFVTAPLEKPPIPLPDVARPAPPAELPALPVVAVLIPPRTDKPIAPMRAPRTLPCVGAWLGIPSESLECGRARFQRGEYDEALRALEQANRPGTERETVAEARYWLAETHYRSGRVEQADALFRQVAAEGARGEFSPWALHGGGWTALRLGEAVRARDAFAQLLALPHPPALTVWARYGHAAALTTLGQRADAVGAWGDLAGRRVPPMLERDVLFWHGETLLRTGDFERAASELARFTRGGTHPLQAQGLVRLGWALLHGQKFAEATTAFRTFLAGRGPEASGGPERDAAEAGLALALLGTGDAEGARRLVQPLEVRAPAWATPALLWLLGAAIEGRRLVETHAIVQTLLAAPLRPPVRAWVLLVSAEAYRLDGARDEARTRYELARGLDAGSVTGRTATLRLAQVNFELREFAQAAADVAPLASEAEAPELRRAAVLLLGEAAYYAGDYPTASAAYQRILAQPAAPAAARLALAWTALRQGQVADARREFIEFVAAAPNDPHAVDALVVASELTLAAEEFREADALLEHIVLRYATSPRAEFARLNRAIMLIRAGEGTRAEVPLREWIARNQYHPLVGRAFSALGAALLSGGKMAAAGAAFVSARREGGGALASLGLGIVAIAQRRWDDAAREFTDARDTAPAAIAADAEYGLAVATFRRGRPADFMKLARRVLEANLRGGAAADLLYAMAVAAVDQKDWAGALEAAKRLVADFPDASTADDALARVGGAAGKAGAWPVSQEAWSLLRARYPQSPFVEESRLPFAEAQLQAGNLPEARAELERFVAANPTDPRVGGAWLTLGRLRAQGGDRAGAVEAFQRAPLDTVTAPWPRELLLTYARLLYQERRWPEGRVVVERLLRRETDPAGVAEAATLVGDSYDGEGDHLAAAEYYMTAAYMAPQTAAGRQALLGAGRAFGALKQPDAAEKVYRRLLNQANLPADMAAAAKRALAEIKR